MKLSCRGYFCEKKKKLRKIPKSLGFYGGISIINPFSQACLCRYFSSVPDPGGSGFKLPGWNQDLDPYSESGSGSWKWNWAIKVHFFHKFFMIFTYPVFLKWYQIKVLCLIKYLPVRYLLDWLKTKLNTYFWVENKNFAQNLVFAFDKVWLFCLEPGSGSGKKSKSRIRIRKKRIRIRNTD